MKSKNVLSTRAIFEFHCRRLCPRRALGTNSGILSLPFLSPGVPCRNGPWPAFSTLRPA
jgi:hypothetical protein